MHSANAGQLRTLWRNLHIRPGCVLMCHSFLPSLGRLLPGPDVVVDTLLEQLGPSGTLVVPTFTYSYFKGEIYHVEHTPSTVGVLGDLVRRRPSAVRSLDPNFSMAAVGNSAASLMSRETPHSFGPGSIYDRLMHTDLWFLLLGVDYTALSAFMHLEKLHGVSYRYDKSFTGVTRSSGRTFTDTAIHFVRDLERNPISQRNRIGALIDRVPTSTHVSFGYGEHRVFSAVTLQRLVAENLRRDPFCLLEAPVG